MRRAAFGAVLAIVFPLAAPLTAAAAAPAPAAGAALTRAVCDGRNQRVSDPACGVGYRVTRAEGAPATGIADVDAAYTYLGDVSAFYARLGGDLQQMAATDVNGVQAVNVSVRICTTAATCPQNSPTYYTNKHVVIAENLMSDDTFAHEFTHAVQDYHRKLPSQNSGEPLAVSEGMADILGELVDQGNGSSDDTAANRWLMGEGSPTGVYRRMANPNTNRPPMPDRKNGQYWDSSGNSSINAAVVEKAGFLISDGQSFNGQDITGIGTAKSAVLWYETLKTMPLGADFAKLAVTLRSACATLVQAGASGFTSGDCTQVRKATIATALDDGGPATNADPTVTNPGDQTSVTGTAVNKQVSATDADGDAVTFRASGLPAGLSISTSGLITGTPTTEGVNDVVVTAEDGKGGSGRAAFRWTVTSGGGGSCSGANTTATPIPDRSSVTSDIAISGCSSTASASSAVSVEITHSYRGDLAIDLLAPDGTAYRLRTSQSSDSGRDLRTTYTANLSSEAANGTWRLKVTDAYAGDTGTLTRWGIDLAPAGR